MGYPIFNKNKGFSLLEVILAIFVITIGVTGALNLMTYSISSVAVSESQIIAVNLAQEGLELIRNIRDSNWIEQRKTQGFSWKAGLDSDGDYQIDCHEGILHTYDSGDSLSIDSYGFYQYGTGTLTPFQRKITITNLGPNEISIVSEVKWSQRGRTYKVGAEDRLYNWK